MPVSSFPRIVLRDRTGTPTSNCPHCGAHGSVIHYFQVEDGRHLGAMSGCVKLFPASPIATTDIWLRKRVEDISKRGRQPASWHQKMRAAVDDFYEGVIDERTALDRIRVAHGEAKAYRARRGWR